MVDWSTCERARLYSEVGGQKTETLLESDTTASRHRVECDSFSEK